MGIFNTINQKSGLIATIIVVAVALFILQDLFGPNSFFFNNNNVGEIAGQDISSQEYAQTVEKAKVDYSRSRGKNPGENEMADVYNQAWSKLIFKYAYSKEIKALGISVPEEEVEEMISGKNLHETIMKTPFFQDSLTGQFSREKYNQWKIKNASVLENFKAELYQERESIKFMNLIQKSVYVTKEEAKKDYLAQNTKAEVKYLYVPFYSIPDDSFKVSDNEIEDYIANHKKEFKMEDRRSVEYVSFPIAPSSKDTLQVKTELAELAKEFATTEEDSLFAMNNSDQPAPPSVIGLGQLPEPLKARIDNLTKGEVVGPFNDGGRLKLYKVLDIIEDPKDSVYYASTKHILFMTRGKSPAEKDSIKRKATQVLDELKKGADFDQMVMTYSEDPGSKSKGGEYKWFPKGQMVKPFEQAVFGATSKGLVGKLVETEYGFHILKVTDTKSNKKIKVATIDKEIGGMEGRELAYQKAANFAAEVKDTATFRKAAKKDSLSIQKANNFKANDTYIGSLMNPRELVRWAFNTAGEGDVSPVYTIGEQYVVAVLSRKKSKGTADADDSRDAVKSKVIAEKKAKQIVEKLKNLEGDIDKKAQAYGPSASRGIATDVTLSSGSIQGIGSDAVLTGTVFGLVPGKRTLPLVGENGVAILELVKITEAPAIADYSSYKNTAVKQKEGSIMNDVDKAIRDAADIKDERVKFF